jgi:hypothetical protein
VPDIGPAPVYRALNGRSTAGDLGNGHRISNGVFAVQNFFSLKLFFDFLIFSASGKEVLGGDHDDRRTVRCSGPTLHFVRARGALAKRQ